MNHIKMFEQFSQVSESIEFKDINGKVAKVGDFIKHDNDTVGKVKRIFKSGSNDRMEVDFNSHYLELNPKSEFEIIEDTDKKLAKIFA